MPLWKQQQKKNQTIQRKATVHSQKRRWQKLKKAERKSTPWRTWFSLPKQPPRSPLGMWELSPNVERSTKLLGKWRITTWRHWVSQKWDGQEADNYRMEEKTSYTLDIHMYMLLTWIGQRSGQTGFITVLILGISKSGGDPPPLHKMWGGAKNSGGRLYDKV